VDLESQYRMLVESLRLVAAPAPVQIDALPDFVIPTDEIGSSFGDAYLLIPQLERNGLVSAHAHTAIQALEEWFEKMPVDGSIAAPETLFTHSFWARELATTALTALHEPIQSPSFDRQTWVRGA
jgi:hypothetical protein